MKLGIFILLAGLTGVLGGCALFMHPRDLMVQQIWQDCMGYNHYTFNSDHRLYNLWTYSPRTFASKKEQDCYANADSSVITVYHDSSSPPFYPVIIMNR